MSFVKLYSFLCKNSCIQCQKSQKVFKSCKKSLLFFSLKHHHKQDKTVFFLHVFGRISNDFAFVYIYFLHRLE